MPDRPSIARNCRRSTRAGLASTQVAYLLPSRRPGMIWKGHVSFGLVNIPVALHPAVKREELDFTKYRDEYREELMAFIRKRAKDGRVEEAAAAPVPAPKRTKGEVIDLIALLKQNAEQGSAARGARRRPSARARRSA